MTNHDQKLYTKFGISLHLRIYALFTSVYTLTLTRIRKKLGFNLVLAVSVLVY